MSMPALTITNFTHLEIVLCDTALYGFKVLIMPPTLKKLEGHIAFGLSVCVCVCLSVCVCVCVNF